jgi:hypothetical protein
MLATFPNHTDPKVLRHTSKVQNTGHLSRKPSPIVQACMDKRRRGSGNIVGGSAARSGWRCLRAEGHEFGDQYQEGSHESQTRLAVVLEKRSQQVRGVTRMYQTSRQEQPKDLCINGRRYRETRKETRQREESSKLCNI